MNAHTYMGVVIDRAPSNGYGFRWVALVSFPRFAGYLKAETLADMRRMIRHYKGVTP